MSDSFDVDEEVTDPAHGGKIGVQIRYDGTFCSAQLSDITAVYFKDERSNVDIDQESGDWGACVTLSAEEARKLYLTLGAMFSRWGWATDHHTA